MKKIITIASVIIQLGILVFIALTLYEQKNFNKLQQEIVYAQTRPKIAFDLRRLKELKDGKVRFQSKIANHGVATADIWFTDARIDTTIDSPFPSADLSSHTQYTITVMPDSVLDKWLQRRHAYLCYSCSLSLQVGPVGISGVATNKSFLQALRKQKHYLHIVLVYADFRSSYLINHTYSLEVIDKDHLTWRFINSSEETIEE